MTQAQAILILVLVLAACGGDRAPAPSPDAGPTEMCSVRADCSDAAAVCIDSYCIVPGDAGPAGGVDAGVDAALSPPEITANGGLRVDWSRTVPGEHRVLATGSTTCEYRSRSGGIDLDFRVEGPTWHFAMTNVVFRFTPRSPTRSGVIQYLPETRVSVGDDTGMGFVAMDLPLLAGITEPAACWLTTEPWIDEPQPGYYTVHWIRMQCRSDIVSGAHLAYAGNHNEVGDVPTLGQGDIAGCAPAP